MQPSVEDPHTLIFSIAAVLCLLVPVTIVGTRRDLSFQRKVYWSSTFAAVVCVVLAFLPNLLTGALLGLLPIFLMVIRAYFATQYIKIGRRVIAFDSPPAAGGRTKAPQDSEPYSQTVSARKLWWLLAVAVGSIGAGNLWLYVLGRSELRYGVLGLGVMVVFALLYGVADAMHQQRVARGQILQFAILSVVSAGLFALCYLGAHAATRALKG
jgi:cadmium resistance protein CadD (predicted permease)